METTLDEYGDLDAEVPSECRTVGRTGRSVECRVTENEREYPKGSCNSRHATISWGESVFLKRKSVSIRIIRQ